MATPHVLIAGGGIGGLTAALALLKRGFDVDVYEQAPALREVGAGLQLSANGNRALYALGVERRAAAARLRGDGEGSAPLEHRPDMETLRSRRGLGERASAFPTSPSTGPTCSRSSREPCGARRPTPSISARAAPAARRIGNRRDPAFRRGRGRGRRAGRRRWRALADPAGALRRGLSRSSPASSPGAARSRCRASPITCGGWSAPTGSAPARTSCTTRCTAASA